MLGHEYRLSATHAHTENGGYTYVFYSYIIKPQVWVWLQLME